MSSELTPTIQIGYKDGLSQQVLKGLMITIPLWGLWAPIAIYSLATGISHNTMSDTDYYGTLLYLCLSSLVFLICCFSVIVCRQNKFEISRAGIKFPLRYLLQFGPSLFCPWDRIKQIIFLNTEKATGVISKNPSTMQIDFGGAVLQFELEGFAKKELERLVLAFQSYVPNMNFEPALCDVNLGFEKTIRTRADASFTQIWEDDMNSRFGSTAFVPLEAGAKLQDQRIEIVGQIAFGGLSAIYLAKAKDGKLRVVKEAVMPANSDSASSSKALEMFSREAQVLMSIDNESIAKVFDYFVENGRHYIVLEYIDGCDLRKYVKENGPQSEDTIIRWTIEIAELLHYLHSMNPPVIHRDLTPDNLVLEKNGRIVLIDFGAANHFIGTATGTLVGKQSYISPEQFRGHAEPASDFYSLGATLHFLLTGCQPEALNTSYPRTVNPDVSEDVDAFVAKLTNMEVEERFKSAEQIKDYAKELQMSRKSAHTISLGAKQTQI